MDTSRKIAIIVGVLFIIGTAAGVLSVVVTQPMLGAEDILWAVSTHQTRMVTGALLVLTMGLALAMLPVVIYPVLKQHNPILALGYVVFRGALEPITYLGTVVGWLLLVPLSRASVISAYDAGFKTLGDLLLKEAEISSMLTALVFPIGALMLYVVLYQSKLIPRWMSVWGLLAVVLHFFYTGLFGLFSLAHPVTTNLDILNLPIFLQEMVMAVWLIVKGFNSESLVRETK